MAELTTEFEELLALFVDRGVEFLIVGGHAVGFYGKPRPRSAPAGHKLSQLHIRAGVVRSAG